MTYSDINREPRLREFCGAAEDINLNKFLSEEEKGMKS